MKTINSQLTHLIGIMSLVLLPQLSIANDRWAEFVPSSSQLKFEKTHNQNKWHKATWSSGLNFKSQNDLRYDVPPSNIVNAKEYMLTEPQRKSVNPWQVKRNWLNRQYKIGPSVRPWGSVPEKFQKKSSQVSVHRIQNTNRNFMPPMPLYRPYVNNNVLNHSNSLLPVGGYLPFYSNQMYSNSVPFFTPPFSYSRGYSNGSLWR